MDHESPPESTVLRGGSKDNQAAKPKTMANVLKNSVSNVRQELDVTVDQMLGKVKSVFYYISNRLNRKLILETFRRNFKSLAFETFRFYQSPEGIRFIVLEIGLFTKSPSYLNDLARTASVSHKTSVLQSIPDDELDEAGRFIPRPERNKFWYRGWGFIN